MIDRTVVVGPFQCNCHVLVCASTGEAALVDPGDDPARILAELDTASRDLGRPLKLKYLLHTHAHLDHIGATRAVKEAITAERGESPPSILLHRDDQFIYDILKAQGSLFGLKYDDPLPIDEFLEDGQDISVGSLKFNVIHTPGHSPGGVCFRLHENSAEGASESVFTGDTLFQGSIGRTDLWGGDQDLLIKSIRSRLLPFDDDTRICPGHGPDSRIGIERRSNPFLT